MSVTASPALAAAVGATLGTAATGLQLQPGTVVAARVQQVLEAGLTRILIAGMALDVSSQVALKPGTHLQLAVSQTPDAIELAIVGQGRSAAAAAANARANTSSAGGNAPATLRLPTTTPLPTQIVGRGQSTASTSSQAAPRAASPEVKAVLNETVQTAAPRQASLAPLFANVAAASSLKSLPSDVAEKAAQLLALRPELGATLTADDIQQAFKSSGLFLEQNLKAGAVLSGAGAPTAIAAPSPDLKAALLVFRQVLATWSEVLPETSSAAKPAAPNAAAAQLRASIVSNATATLPQMSPQAQPSVQLATAPPVVPVQGSTDATEPAAKGAPMVRADGIVPKQPPSSSSSPDVALARAIAALSPNATASSDADLLSQVLQSARATAQRLDAASPLSPHAGLPQPPFRGAAPSAQSIAQPTVTAASPQADIAGTLLRDTDAALSRQTLHQIASLPDRVDLTLPRADANTPRWSFEIPFATPQGTAVAQFEISADGGGNGEKTSKQDRVWRVRFSLDVEPAGAVHASIAMVAQSDDAPPRTSVRLWAERPETAERLKSASDDLLQALRRAELEPGSIVIGDGSPTPSVHRSGRFLDRAS